MPNIKPYNEQELLTRITAGDEQAFTQFYQIYSPHVFKVAMLYAEKDVVLAEECVQITFMKIWEGREKLQQIQQLRDYLFIVARNLIFDQFKSRAREDVLKRAAANPASVGENIIYHRMEEREYDRLLLQAVQQLPPQQKQVYKMAREEGLAHENIAAQTGLSLLTVRTHLKLALRSVRRYLTRHLPDPLLLILFVFAQIIFL